MARVLQYLVLFVSLFCRTLKGGFAVVPYALFVISVCSSPSKFSVLYWVSHELVYLLILLSDVSI
jgi:hypothetical protein